MYHLFHLNICRKKNYLYALGRSIQQTNLIINPFSKPMIFLIHSLNGKTSKFIYIFKINFSYNIRKQNRITCIGESESAESY